MYRKVAYVLKHLNFENAAKCKNCCLLNWTWSGKCISVWILKIEFQSGIDSNVRMPIKEGIYLYMVEKFLWQKER